MCPDCVECEKNFDRCGIPYRFVDINASLSNLKQFLILRDSSPVFDRCKKVSDIGLPALVKDDGEVFLSWEKYLEEQGHQAITEKAEANACSVDGKGC